jgi:hypothetical protein
MESTAHDVDTLIILGPDQATFYEFLKSRQGARGRTLVVLDRRRRERRNGPGQASPDRRRRQRRAPVPEAALALMSVLGFMVLHRAGNRWTE